MEHEQFESYVNEALAMVPERIQTKIENVAFVLDSEQRGSLLGLYHGIPLIRRNQGYSGVLPDKITIYQRAIEDVAGPGEGAIRELVISVVHHEIAHYFGFSEAEVRRWEQKRKQRKTT